jgi:hypothetical protein
MLSKSRSIALLFSSAWLGVTLGGCSVGNKQLSKTDIQLAAGDLRTFAASTQMLVEQCSAQHATEIFCHEQSALLSGKVDDALKELQGQGGDTEYERQQLSNAGLDLREIALRAEQSSNTPGDAEYAARIASTTKVLEDSLRK